MEALKQSCNSEYLQTRLSRLVGSILALSSLMTSFYLLHWTNYIPCEILVFGEAIYLRKVGVEYPQMLTRGIYDFQSSSSRCQLQLRSEWRGQHSYATVLRSGPPFICYRMTSPFIELMIDYIIPCKQMSQKTSRKNINAT